MRKVAKLIDALNASNSNLDKIAALKTHADNPEVKEILFYMFNPYFQYHVTWKNVQKRQDIVRSFKGNWKGLLDLLRTRAVTGHDAIGIVNGFLNTQCEDSDSRLVLQRLLERSLKARCDSKMINKVFPNLIPTFNVALANAYEKHANKIDWENDEWYWSRKLDGVRVICRVENGTVKFFSRQGKQFYTLDKIEMAIRNHPMIEKDFILDGELCIVDGNDDEDFQSVIKEIRRKDHTIKNPCFKVFDHLTLQEFDTQVSRRTLKERLNELQWLIGNYLHKSSFPIDEVVHEKIEDFDDVIRTLDFADSMGWEGIMIRKNTTYKGKRSNDILKCKKFIDDEYIVKNIETGPFRVIDKVTKKEKTIDTMTNVIIEHKGNEVSVGSGFSLDQRDKYFNNPTDIIGKEITVQYFEESQDKTGKFSLRFPVCKVIYEQGRQV
jgi:DNA ligase-1